MFKFQEQRVKARKILLNKADVITFDNVPDHIVDAFFGTCSYKNRLIIEKPRYQTNYYSYNVHHQCVMFLNGDRRQFGQRVPRPTNI